MLRNLLGVAALGLALSGCVTTSTTVVSSNKSVTIVNNSGYTITNFYGSNSGTNSWQEDILGASTLPSGSSANINFEDGSGFCSFDFKVVFGDGSSVIEQGIDVCTISTYTIQ
jgi:hypothetical protein